MSISQHVYEALIEENLTLKTHNAALVEALESVLYAIDCGGDIPWGKTTMFSHERIQELHAALAIATGQPSHDRKGE